MPLKVVTREDWGAVPAKSGKPLKTPVNMLLMLDTESEECNTKDDCLKLVKELQRKYMEEKGFDDIPWSYMIGGDGSIYEGRGYKVQPIKTDLTNPKLALHDGKSIDIAYIGDYKNEYWKKNGRYPNERACDASHRLYVQLGNNNIIDMDDCERDCLT